MRRCLVLALPFVVTAGATFATDFKSLQEAYLHNSVRVLAQDLVLVAANFAANAARAGLDRPAIDALDAAWRAEIGASEAPTILPVLINPGADFLRRQGEASAGVITEAFITDALGRNVAVSAPTSDMWQADEEKFSETFPKGNDASYFAGIELDQSTRTNSGQISITIADPATGATIGSLTVGINNNALM